MPKIDGKKVLKKIKEDKKLKKIPVIITSNLGQEEEIQKGLDLGAVEYFVKSNVRINELVQKVQNALIK